MRCPSAARRRPRRPVRPRRIVFQAGQAVTGLGRALGRRVGRRVPRPVYRLWHRAFRFALDIYVRRLAASRRPVVVGPWTSEIGFELLYWIPFLERLRSRGALVRERTYVVSRGANAAWYGHIGAHHYNFFDAVPPQEYQTVVSDRARTIEKQIAIDAFDRKVLRLALARFGLAEYHLVHPFLMYDLLLPIWRAGLPVEYEVPHVDFRPFATTPSDSWREAMADLEGRPYVALKLYFNQNFRDTAENVAWARGFVEALGRRTTVALLDVSVGLDNHDPLGLDDGQGVVRLAGRVPLSENLGFQTEVVRGARCFIATLGGFCFLPAFLRSRCVALYSGEFNAGHLELGYRLYEALSPGGLSIQATDSVDLNGLP